MDVWWFRLGRTPGEGPNRLQPHMRGTKFGITIPRRDFYQVAYLGRKGTDAELRRRGIDAFRHDVADLMPDLADRVHELTTMDDVKHLDVRLNRLERWHTDGLLCIGDAAHAMSPVGGVGINLAVQDAVAAARVLAGPLRRGRVDDRVLAAVRRRRIMPTVIVQGLQRLLHRMIVSPVVDGRRPGPPRLFTALMRRAPWLSTVPALIVGIGPRPERAPVFARR